MIFEFKMASNGWIWVHFEYIEPKSIDVDAILSEFDGFKVQIDVSRFKMRILCRFLI